MIVPIDPRFAPPKKGGRLFESAADRANQRRAMEALLVYWREIDSHHYDAIDLGRASPVDYYVVPGGSYSGEGPAPIPGAAAVEYKRRRGSFWALDYDSIFIETAKHVALLEASTREHGRPIFIAEWDDILQFVDVRLSGTPGVMPRLDRGLPEDIDEGYYYTTDKMKIVRQAIWAKFVR